MSVETLDLLDDLPKTRMRHTCGGLDDNRLGVLYRNHLANALLALWALAMDVAYFWVCFD